MAIETREIYQINQATGQRRYSGYAKFDGDKFLGSFGGYTQQGNLAEWGDTSAKDKGYSKKGKSALQNNIKMSGVNQAKRTKKAFNYKLL